VKAFHAFLFYSIYRGKTPDSAIQLAGRQSLICWKKGLQIPEAERKSKRPTLVVGPGVKSQIKEAPENRRWIHKITGIRRP
jgi:hypothetical protein